MPSGIGQQSQPTTPSPSITPTQSRRGSSAENKGSPITTPQEETPVGQIKVSTGLSDQSLELTITPEGKIRQRGQDSGSENQSTKTNTPTQNPEKRRSSYCEKFTNSLMLGIPILIRTFINVSITGSIGLAAKAGLISSMISTEDKPSQVLVVAAGSTFFAASAICMAPRLGKLLIPRDSTRCAELVRGALGYSPWLIMGAQVLTATQMPNLSPPAIALAGVVVQRIMSNVLRDINTQFSTGIVPRYEIIDDKGHVLHDEQIINSINKQRTMIATVFYFAISTAFVYYQKNESLNKAFGTDGKEYYEGGKKNFEGIFMAGMPSVVLRALAESVDDVGILIAAALTARHHNLEIKNTPVDTKFVKANFSNYKKTLNNALDAASMRTLMGSLVMSASNTMVRNKEKMSEDTIKWLNITAQALTECRGYLLEIRQNERNKFIRENPLGNDFLLLKRARALTPKQIEEISKTVLEETDKNDQITAGEFRNQMDASGGVIPGNLTAGSFITSSPANNQNQSVINSDDKSVKFHTEPAPEKKVTLHSAPSSPASASASASVHNSVPVPVPAPEIPTTSESKHSPPPALSSLEPTHESTPQHKKT